MIAHSAIKSLLGPYYKLHYILYTYFCILYGACFFKNTDEYPGELCTAGCCQLAMQKRWKLCTCLPV